MRHYSMRLVAEGRADGRDVSLKKLDACVCVCECELDAAGVALSQIDKHNMRHYSKRLSRVCACVNVNLTLLVLPLAR